MGHFGIIFESFWGHFRIFSGSFLGLFFGKFGVIYGTSLGNFGVFFELDSQIDCLCHIMEVSWSRVNDTSEISGSETGPVSDIYII